MLQFKRKYILHGYIYSHCNADNIICKEKCMCIK